MFPESPLKQVCGRHHRLFNTINSKQSEPVFVWDKYSSFSFTKLQQYACLMLRLLRKHKHFRGPTAQITDQAELANVKDKLLLLAQSELFPVEFKQLQSGIPV